MKDALIAILSILLASAFFGLVGWLFMEAIQEVSEVGLKSILTEIWEGKQEALE